MAQRSRELGGGAINLIVALLILTGVGLALAQVLPVQSRRAKLADFMVEQTKHAARLSAKSLSDSLYKKAVELKVPVDKKDVMVTRSGDRVLLKCEYVERLNFVVYQYDWKIAVEVDRPIYHF